MIQGVALARALRPRQGVAVRAIGVRVVIVADGPVDELRREAVAVLAVVLGEGDAQDVAVAVVGFVHVPEIIERVEREEPSRYFEQPERIDVGERIAAGVGVAVVGIDEAERVGGEVLAARRIVIAVYVVVQAAFFVEILPGQAQGHGEARPGAARRRLGPGVAEGVEVAAPDEPPVRVRNRQRQAPRVGMHGIDFAGLAAAAVALQHRIRPMSGVQVLRPERPVRVGFRHQAVLQVVQEDRRLAGDGLAQAVAQGVVGVGGHRFAVPARGAQAVGGIIGQRESWPLGPAAETVPHRRRFAAFAEGGVGRLPEQRSGGAFFRQPPERVVAVLPAFGVARRRREPLRPRPGVAHVQQSRAGACHSEFGHPPGGVEAACRGRAVGLGEVRGRAERGVRHVGQQRRFGQRRRQGSVQAFGQRGQEAPRRVEPAAFPGDAFDPPAGFGVAVMQPLAVGQRARPQPAVGRAVGVLRVEVEPAAAGGRVDALGMPHDQAEGVAREGVRVAAAFDPREQRAGVVEPFGALAARPFDEAALRVEAQRFDERFAVLATLAFDDAVVGVGVVEQAFVRCEFPYRTAEVVAPEVVRAAGGVAQGGAVLADEELPCAAIGRRRPSSAGALQVARPAASSTPCSGTGPVVRAWAVSSPSGPSCAARWPSACQRFRPPPWILPCGSRTSQAWRRPSPS